jgi:hypothetical protein
VSVQTDETRAPAGSAGRTRRPGGHRLRGTMMRLPEDVHAALENEARETGASKVGIVEQLLRRRYRLGKAA